MALRKLCQHPDLVDLEKELPGSESTYPPGYNPSDSRRVPDTSLGGKMAVLDRFLVKMRAESNDKLVLVSNFTTTLDLFEKLLRGLRYVPPCHSLGTSLTLFTQNGLCTTRRHDEPQQASETRRQVQRP
jgi:hypothetical protein